MKKLFCIAAAIVLLAACKQTDKKETPVTNTVTSMAGGDVTISGSITGLGNEYLELSHQEEDGIKRDTLQGTMDKFTFTTKLKEPTQYVLGVLEAGEKPTLLFFADPGTISINGAVDSLDKAGVKGGATQTEYKNATASLNKIFEKATPYYEQFGQAQQNGDEVTVKKIKAIFDSLNAEAGRYVLNYAASNKSSLVAINFLTISKANGGQPDEIAKLLDGFEEPVKNSIIGRRLKAELDAGKSTAIGGIAMDFTQNDINGKPVSLSSFRGKYLLIDFWASWCGPCRAENPNVVKAYNAYKNKGFEILGVSLDQSKEPWLAAIKKDKLAWTQVSDLKGWENAVSQKYRIESIPASFLLDKDGKIIARDLRGEALEKKLKELMP